MRLTQRLTPNTIRKVQRVALTFGFVVLFVVCVQSASGTGARHGASGGHPTWSAQRIEANPGQPFSVILDPGQATVCFVGLRGPNRAAPVGWRFQPSGHRLNITLLTHADAASGEWTLRASCQHVGGTAPSATVTISVPATGGGGVLAAHGDMRVALLPAETYINPPSPKSTGVVLARQTITPSSGGYVLATNRVWIFVPPGVVTRTGEVSITSLGHDKYDIGINVPWRGQVAVSVPLRNRTDSIIHDVGGIWVAEGAHRGQSAVWVQELSPFSTLLSKAAAVLCLSWNIHKVEECLIEKGLSHIDGKLAHWIASQISSSCLAAFVADFGSIPSIAVDWFNNPACIGQAGETSLPPPPTSTPPTSITPTSTAPTSTTPTSTAPTSTTPTSTGPTSTAPTPSSISIAWSSTHAGWITMSISGLASGSYSYTCNFASGGNQTFSVAVTGSPTTYDNGKTCYDLIAGDTVWVTINGVASNSITVGSSGAGGGSPPPSPSLTISVGAHGTSSYCTSIDCQYIVVSGQNFTPNTTYTLYYDTDCGGASYHAYAQCIAPPDPGTTHYYSESVTTNSSGNFSVSDRLFGFDGGPSVWVDVNGVGSNHVVWP
jgi:hypothetical protein